MIVEHITGGLAIPQNHSSSVRVTNISTTSGSSHIYINALLKLGSGSGIEEKSDGNKDYDYEENCFDQRKRRLIVKPGLVCYRRAQRLAKL